MKTRRPFLFGRIALFGIAGLFLFTLLVMLLWNWLVPELFNGPVLTYWQTLGILLLSKILFSGIGRSHHRDRHPFHSHPWKDRDRWRKKFEEKMNGMTGEKEEDGEVITN
jgi:hypothetical protein